MNLSSLQGEEKLFLRRLEDLSHAGAAPRFSPFLTQRQVDIARAYIHQTGREEDAIFYGGYPNAERVVLGVFPPHITPGAALFPVRAVTLNYRKDIKISHRDILGACLGLLVTRESIGDIVMGENSAVVFALEKVAAVIVDELVKVGNAGVRCTEGTDGDVQGVESFDPIRGTVMSPRMDSLVSLLTGISREKSAALIKADRVQQNYMPATVSAQFKAGDVVTIRGYGKFIVDHIGNPTKKGRLPIESRKYR